MIGLDRLDLGGGNIDDDVALGPALGELSKAALVDFQLLQAGVRWNAHGGRGAFVHDSSGGKAVGGLEALDGLFQALVEVRRIARRILKIAQGRKTGAHQGHVRVRDRHLQRLAFKGLYVGDRLPAATLDDVLVALDGSLHGRKVGGREGWKAFGRVALPLLDELAVVGPVDRACRGTWSKAGKVVFLRVDRHNGEREPRSGNRGPAAHRDGERRARVLDHGRSPNRSIAGAMLGMPARWTYDLVYSLGLGKRKNDNGLTGGLP